MSKLVEIYKLGKINLIHITRIETSIMGSSPNLVVSKILKKSFRISQKWMDSLEARLSSFFISPYHFSLLASWIKNAALVTLEGLEGAMEKFYQKN